METKKAFQASYGNRAGDTFPEAPLHRESWWSCQYNFTPTACLEKTDLQEDEGRALTSFPATLEKLAHRGQPLGPPWPRIKGDPFHSSGLFQDERVLLLPLINAEAAA